MSELSTSEARKLMEVYKSMCAPQQENLSEEVEQIDEQGTGSTSRPSFRAQQATAQRQVSQRLASGGDIKLRDANPLRPNKPFSNPVSGSALPNQSNRAFGTELTGKDGIKRQGVVVKNAVGQGRGFAGAADTVNVAGQTLYKARKGSDIVYLQGKDKPKLFNTQKPNPEPGAGDGGGGGGSNNPPANTKTTPPANTKTTPAASSTVLAKQGGVEGKLDKATGKFTAGAFTGAERDRYVARGGSAAPAPAAKPSLKSDIEDTRRMQAASMMRQQGRNMPDGSIPTGDSLKPKPAPTSLGSAAFNKPEIKTPQPAKPLSTSAGFGAGSPMKFGATTPTQATAAAPSTSPAASGSVTGPTARLAAALKPVPMSPREKALNQSYEYDAYDLVLEYLLANGHVDSVDEAHYVMLEMGSETIQNIVSEQSNTLITPKQRRADELKYGAKRTTPVPPARPSGSKVKPGSRMPL